ncbi:hypothetical protein CF150_00575 [Pseudomonas sp. CF150]|nr:hypothetical protein CF150_00575 [Pseudomonas sp. CF150]
MVIRLIGFLLILFKEKWALKLRMFIFSDLFG